MEADTWIAADLAASVPRLGALGELMAAREPLAVLPTPLHRAPRLSAALGRDVRLKRDDLTGTGLGGNKIRKLELLAAQARGADTLVSVGAPQSNHARSVAMAAAMLGLDCHLVLGGVAPQHFSGNLVLDELVGAQLHWAGSHDWTALAAATDTVTAELVAAGRRPYAIPVGGSVPHGSAAFVAAYLELVVQCVESGLVGDRAPSAIVHASSSAGTQAGLALGAALAAALLPGTRWAGVAPEVIGVDVAKITDPLAAEVDRLARATADLLGVADLWPGESTVLDGYLGAGYAIDSPAGEAALRLLARTEGVVLDPVYSAKGFAAVAARDPRLPAGGPLVFWHTGGTPALFATGH